MDREITVTGKSITAKNTDNNRLIINGAVYSSNDPVLLKWEAVYSNTHECTISDEYRIRRNSAGNLYAEHRFTEWPNIEDDYYYTRKDWHILLLDDFPRLYREFLEDEQKYLGDAPEDYTDTIYLDGLYVHYATENGEIKHTDRLPPLEVILNAREDESAPCIKDSGVSYSEPVIIDLFDNDPEHNCLLNWVCYSQQWYDN